MSFRTKLLAFFTLTIIAAVTLVAWGVSTYTRRAFEQLDRQRTDALVAPEGRSPSYVKLPSAPMMSDTSVRAV